MKIISVEFKNIGPYGNVMQKVNLDDNNMVNRLINVSAKNGFGKTTFLNVITFVLYNKVPKINKGDLVNRVNRKNAIGIVKLYDKKNRLIQITRGIQPNKLEVLIDGVPYDAARDVQTFLEEEIYNMDFNVFTNTLSLSVDDFKSFLILTPADKRKIIDKLFGYAVLNDMLKTIKERYKDTQTQLKLFERKLEDKEDLIQEIEESIEAVENSEDSDNTERIKELRLKISEYKDKLKEGNTKYEKAEEVLQKGNNTKLKISNRLSSIQTMMKNVTKKLKLYSNDKCPTCGSDLTSDDHKHVKTDLEKELEKYKSEIEKFDAKLEEVKEKIEKITTRKNKVRKITMKLNSAINDLKDEIAELSESQDTKEIKELQKLLKKYTEEKDEIDKEIESYRTKTEYYDLILKQVLSEDGLKSVLIKRIIAPLNELVAKYNEELDLDKFVKFDDKFDVTVKHLGQVINPRTLSAGERKKSDIILLLSVLELIAMQMPSINSLFLDEAFSNLDPENIDLVIKILHKISQKHNIYIYVITHNDVEPQHFGKIIKIDKSNGFSTITEILQT